MGPYASDEFIADLEPARFFNLTENVSTKAVPNVTPEFGRGSQKGRLVGGTAERPVREPVYNLQYHPHTTTKGEAILINKTPVFNNKGQVELVGITDLTQLNQYHENNLLHCKLSKGMLRLCIQLLFVSILL